MSYWGTISLYKGEKRLHEARYYSTDNRKKIIDNWRRLYREDMDILAIHIRPIIIDLSDKETFTKSKQPITHQNIWV